MRQLNKVITAQPTQDGDGVSIHQPGWSKIE